ncbi:MULTISPECIES: SusC/RagA family TonB-linked outer membrane protein [unclassified Sphingobacterium]|uniref:SusC/RagA family TonB-linked outer membrane protein n=1 Tax=unclassified Sphingobacterium TaxID=2609468 RepID=UPI0010495352|nr:MULTISPECIES: SusC/RagA family TonB-linked outer membrane protein [unclassified Sphingobacterium]MCS3554222.1 TonB-linked SusC/RagA family outer membrane protein [Sphingobacterium sp. JUb21]TCR08055.1 TonB-linked SusC/RagA family outer membrane protein [Sphingobacterium sp. JUb20]
MQKTCNGESYVLPQRKFIVPNPALFFGLPSKTNQKINTLKSSILKSENVKHDYAFQEHNQLTVSHIKTHWKLALCILLSPMLHAFNLLLCLLKAIKVIARPCIMIIAVFHSLCLSAQTPRKDSGVNGQVKSELTGVVVSSSDGTPLQGVSVRIDAENLQIKTSQDGRFQLTVTNKKGKIGFSSIGFKSQELNYTSGVSMTVKLIPEDNQLDEVEVVSTGYQKIPKERATGSFVQIDNELLNRRVSTNILDRLEGVTSGVNFNRSSGGAGGLLPANEQTGVSIRGRSTIDNDVSADPLIILDNFPFEGSLEQINPNDIESITVLRDAAAASIWGARSGNGVIVITTKKAAFREQTKIDFNTSTTIGTKPYLKYSRNFIPSSEFMDVERQLFHKGFYNDMLSNNTTFPLVSPYVELLDRHRSGDIDENILKLAEEGFAKIDSRNETLENFYQTSVKNQYAFGIRSGGEKFSNYFSVGYNDNREVVQKSGLKRLTMNISPQFKLLQNLTFSPSVSVTNTTERYGYIYSSPYPYISYTGEDGIPLMVPSGYRDSYLREMESKGFKDWSLRPLEEKELKDTHAKRLHTILNGQLMYAPLNWLSFASLFQYERQQSEYEDLKNKNSYYVRNLVNRYTQVNGTNFTYPIPDADILDHTRDRLEAYNFRINSAMNKRWSDKHQLNALLGAEMKSTIITAHSGRYYGYNHETGTILSNLNFNQYYPINPNGLGSQLIDDGIGNMSEVTRRSVSYFFNGAYQFRERYTLSASARKDGANLYGVKTNDKFVPLWSLGILYDISKENFYKLDFFPTMKLRFTYGYNGNSYNQSAYLIASFNRNTLNGFRQATIQNPPNPSLRWERVRNINLSLQFASKEDRISGSIELFQKDGMDLIQEILLRPSSGFNSYKGNSASVRNRGMDIQLTSINTKGKFNWSTVYLLSLIKDKVLSFNEEYPTRYLVSNSSAVDGPARYGLYIKEGNSLYGVYSYRSSGLDENGDPMGYLNGVETKDYAGIIASNTMDNVNYHGSSRPTLFGSLRNTFSYRKWSLSANILLKSGFYIRKKSSSTNLNEVLSMPNADFMLAFDPQNPNKETSMPALVYPVNASRNTFYQNSEALVLSGDHIRLQDISLSYRMKFSRFTVDFYSYIDNLGILWRKNKVGIDPDINDYFGLYPIPTSYSLGARIQF